MKIEMKKIKVREIYEGYKENTSTGEVVGYGGRLNIRPAFQREFIYEDKQRDEVIKTIKKNFPLNIMYWVKNSDESFEMLDGQQRTISICRYLGGDFSLTEKIGDLKYNQSFFNLTAAEKKKILDYELTIYICEGDDKEKLEWFQVINIAGVELTNQELRNAIYSCEWTTDAKKYFSKNHCPAQDEYGKYLSGNRLRQDFLETALKWIVNAKNLDDVSDYMNIQKKNFVQNADEIWRYFVKVFAWVEKIFPKYRKEMKGLQCGILYNKYGKNDYEGKNFEPRITELMKDFDVTKKAGIYEYLLDGEKNEKYLSIRKFDERTKAAIYEKQGGRCAICGKSYEIEEMHADHKIAWSKGGKTIAENCQILCAECNLKKSNM